MTTYSQFRPTPIRHLDRGPGREKRGLKKAVGDRALRPQLHAQSEEFGPVRPDWRAERPSHDIHLIHGDPIGPYSTAPLKTAENRMRERVDASRASAPASRAAMNAASATIHTSGARAPATGAQLRTSRAGMHTSRASAPSTGKAAPATRADTPSTCERCRKDETRSFRLRVSVKETLNRTLSSPSREPGRTCCCSPGQ
jgi:hypothetical protein